MDALGMLEVFGFTTAVVAADAIAKAGDVEILALDRNKPANGDAAVVPLLMTVKFTGSVAAVEAGLEAGIKVAKDRDLYVTSKIISRVAPDTEYMANLNVACLCYCVSRNNSGGKTENLKHSQCIHILHLVLTLLRSRP